MGVGEQPPTRKIIYLPTRLPLQTLGALPCRCSGSIASWRMATSCRPGRWRGNKNVGVGNGYTPRNEKHSTLKHWGFKMSGMVTVQGTNISPKNGILKMIFLFPRWDMLIPWRVAFLEGQPYQVLCWFFGECRYWKRRHDNTLAFTAVQSFVRWKQCP